MREEKKERVKIVEQQLQENIGNIINLKIDFKNDQLEIREYHGNGEQMNCISGITLTNAVSLCNGFKLSCYVDLDKKCLVVF